MASKVTDPEFRKERARRAAMVRNGHALTLADRFWPLVKKSDGCWEWQGATSTSGYGELRIDRKHVKAHRVSWQLANGEIPAGQYVCHHCDNVRCVRPDHLFLGTHTDNMRDAQAKGRLRGRCSA